MFWGLIMEPGRCYSQTVKVSFHISMASLDISSASQEPTQVMCMFEGRNYLLCTLTKKDNIVQCPLDLNFEVGSTIAFATNGKSHVHLTGYLTALDDDLFEEDEEVAGKSNKRSRKNVNGEPPTKKSKLKQLVDTEEIAEEEESDSDFDVNKLLNGEEDDEDDGEEESEEEDDAQEEEAGGEEEEEDEEEEDSSVEEETEEEEEQAPKQKVKQNGVVSKKQQQTQQKIEKPTKEKKQKPEAKSPQPKKQVLKGGVMIEELREGLGDVAKPGKFVHVYYEGRLKSNNKLFDSTTKGPGFGFRIGKGEVIKGWDVGVVGMKIGGKRRITCPPNAAYGAKGSPPVIPPNSTLVFEVDLKKMN